jgi:hypothetical protein
MIYMRVLVPQLVIALAVCVGAHMLLVQGPARRLADEQVQLARLEAKLSELRGSRESLPARMRLLERVRERAEEVESQSQMVATQGAHFAAINEIADECDVILEQLEPIRADVPADQQPRPGDAGAGYHMTVVATYANLARFTDALTHDLGFARIESCQIIPAHARGPGAVVCVIKTRHFAFDASPMPAPVEGGGA